MQIDEDPFFHLTYCTNVHPGQDWTETFDSLKIHLPNLKTHFAPSRSFGVGLRLSDQASRELLQQDHLAVFKRWLKEHGLYVYTINGFPYGAFHRQRVKDQVHVPDWRTPERVHYTVRLAGILDALLPEDMEGSISTSPLSYKPWLDEEGREEAFRTGSKHLANVTAELIRLQERSGKHLHIDLEPEPDGLIENTSETIDFFNQWLLPVGGEHLAEEHGLSRHEAEKRLRAHIGVCYDTCHFALEYEKPADALAQLAENDIRVGKVQLSAALQATLSNEPGERDEVAAALRPFAEHIYLHQVVERRADGAFHHYPDLPEALDCIDREAAREWRIHYHVPIFADHYAALASTQQDIEETLEVLQDTRASAHLEIETYTWDVLPPALKMDLTDSIRREYDWVLAHFEE